MFCCDRVGGAEQCVNHQHDWDEEVGTVEGDEGEPLLQVAWARHFGGTEVMEEDMSYDGDQRGGHVTSIDHARPA